MIEFKYEDAAKRGEAMPDGLTLAEQLCFRNIAMLTMQYRAGALTAEDAQKQMMVIKREYANLASKELYVDRVARLWIDIELASMKYNKNRTLEDADEMRDILYGFRRYTKEQQDKLLEEIGTEE